MLWSGSWLDKRRESGFPVSGPNSRGRRFSSYTDTRGEKHIVYTLYRCIAYQWEAYRVHIADESNPANPVYELLPVSEGPHTRSPDYTEPWNRDQIAAKYPLFLKDMDYYFRERRVDPSPLEK